jgi:hypothetical protein
MKKLFLTLALLSSVAPAFAWPKLPKMPSMPKVNISTATIQKGANNALGYVVSTAFDGVVYASDNPGRTTGIVLAVAGAVYGAKKLYNRYKTTNVVEANATAEDTN